jgi:hypothetical protein
MNFRLTTLLLGVVALIVGGLLVAVLVDDTPAPDAGLLAALGKSDPKDIDSIELVRTEPTEQKLVFVHVKDNQWESREPAGPLVEGFQISNLVRELINLKPMPFAEQPGLADAGLKPPTVKVTLKKGGDTSATLLVGDSTAGKEKAVTFVATDARPNVPVAVRRSDLDALFRSGTGSGKAWQLVKWLSDFREKRLLGSGLKGDVVADLKSIRITRGKQELGLAHADSGDWTFTAPANYGLADVAGDPAPKPDVFTGVRPIVQFLTGLTVGGPDDFIESPGPLDTYGLKPDDPNLIRIELTPKAGGTPDVLLIGKKVDDKAVPTKYYVQRAGDPGVAKLQTDRIDALVKTIADPVEMRDRTLVPDTKKESIDAIDVAIGNQTVKLRRVTVGGAREWVLYGGPTDPQIAAPAAQDLVNALTRPRVATEVLTAPNDAAFAPPEVKATVKLWFDGTEPVKEEKKDDKKGEKKDPNALPPEPKLKGDPAVTITFGKKEGDSVFARRKTAAGQTDMKLPEAVLVTASRGRLAYLNPHLKSFPTNAATKVAFNRGAEPFELVKDEKADPQHPRGKWTFAKPDRLKGQLADTNRVLDDLLGLLSTQTASQIVAENPSPDDLKKLGLEPPVTKVTVTLNTETDKERVYLFGHETGDKLAVNAMLVGRPVVFTVPKFVYEKVATADLRDLTLYHIDPAKVKAIQFRGWKQAAGSPVEYEFERKGTTWETKKSPAPFTVDPAKLDALVLTLAAPRPVRSTGDSQLKPEYGLDPATSKNALEIKLTVDGLPAPIQLNLGDETDAGANYFVWSSQKKDEVMVLPGFALRPYKEKPDYLKR